MKILVVGLGNLGSFIFDLLVRVPGKHVFLVGGRNKTYLYERTNLSLLMALQLGYTPEITCAVMDLWDSDQTATVIAQFLGRISYSKTTAARPCAPRMLEISPP